MSNRRRAKTNLPPGGEPPRWRCEDCDATLGRAWFDSDLGIWRVFRIHRDSCPALLGVVPLTNVVWYGRPADLGANLDDAS